MNVPAASLCRRTRPSWVCPSCIRRTLASTSLLGEEQARNSPRRGALARSAAANAAIQSLNRKRASQPGESESAPHEVEVVKPGLEDSIVSVQADNRPHVTLSATSAAGSIAQPASQSIPAQQPVPQDRSADQEPQASQTQLSTRKTLSIAKTPSVLHASHARPGTDKTAMRRGLALTLRWRPARRSALQAMERARRHKPSSLEVLRVDTGHMLGHGAQAWPVARTAAGSSSWDLFREEPASPGKVEVLTERWLKGNYDGVEATGVAEGKEETLETMTGAMARYAKLNRTYGASEGKDLLRHVGELQDSAGVRPHDSAHVRSPGGAR